MSVNILGGVAKGFSLETPSSYLTRPTSVMLKRRLFDSIQDFSNQVFVDLCAGSGSIGFEALSRGADEVYLVENAKNAYFCLKKNKKNLYNKYPDLGETICTKSEMISWLKKNYSLVAEKSPTIFVDPPYEKRELYEGIFNFFSNSSFPPKLILEACEQKTMKIDEFQKRFGEADKIFQQGTTYFIIYDL
ncbi:MAG: RsmD family RNA methyltransferase [Bacteriovoracaceae bacterium]|jgi:16S rRNA (guanine966-N2)-methyltransferase|nr:hypothetical protein [Halobacteriovoraceae bacterium]MDP7319048.1 RsmD family RNA methyltransferase [Bacteriovoracaceae bacterium]|tara:strand:- start:1783 stop:2352 length:570 start_codon:yes stop_codon:yes gene_type:complete